MFDNGVQRSLASQLQVALVPRTSAYGDAFENWLIREIFRLASYAESDFSLSYLRTNDDAEIDLIIERPGLPRLLMGIKSSSHIRPEDHTTIRRFAVDLPGCQAVCLSLDPHPKKIDKIDVLPWQQGLTETGIWRETGT